MLTLSRTLVHLGGGKERRVFLNILSLRVECSQDPMPSPFLAVRAGTSSPPRHILGFLYLRSSESNILKLETWPLESLPKH